MIFKCKARNSAERVFLRFNSCAHNILLPLLQKAYLRRSLEFHPDKQAGSSDKFIILSAAHQLLQDEKRRQHYDKHGEITEQESVEYEKWESYWRNLFPAVTADQIEDFQESYQSNSNGEEEKDVLAAYIEYKGDLNAVVDCIMLAESNDIARFVQDYILPSIERKESKRFKSLSRFEKLKRPEKKQRKRRKAVAKDDDNGSAIVQLKSKSKSSFDELIRQMESKHGGGGGATKGQAPDLPDDAEFEAIQRGLEERRKKRK